MRTPRTFGVEEEYLLLDKNDATPVDRAAELVYATPHLSDSTEREYFSSQLETATPICHTADQAEEVLTEFRRTVAKAAMSHDVVVAGTGLPPVGGDVAGTVTPKPRYRLIESLMRGVAENQYSTGTHVHVEVPSPDMGIEVMQRIARWAPTLLAMTANSPIWCGELTGFSSWRHVMGLTWPVSGYPVGFSTHAEYERTVQDLVGSSIVPDPGLLTWGIRLSDNYPTVELRLADAQLEARSAVSFATIVRALVEHTIAEVQSGVEQRRYAPAMVNGAIWLAARDGLRDQIVDVETSEALPAFALIERMLDTIDTELDAFGDRGRVDDFVRDLREFGGPAERQLSAYQRNGINGLLHLYRSSSLAIFDTGPHGSAAAAVEGTPPESDPLALPA